MDRNRGLIAPPRRFRSSRDPLRRFSNRVVEALVRLQKGSCANPVCNASVDHAEAHHIYAHSLGGPSVLTNGVLLCKSCHALVHRGVVPLPLLIAWRTQGLTLFSPSRADSIMLSVRATPVVKNLSRHERLFRLNGLLIASHSVHHDTDRNALLGQSLLAKVAVLTDTYDRLPQEYRTLERSQMYRYRSILPLTSAAVSFGNVIRDCSIVLRALHYRSIAYAGLGRLDLSLRTLVNACNYAKSVRERLSPMGYHELTTPARVLRALALSRARSGGRASQAIREYEMGLGLAEKYGSFSDWSEARVRLVQLYDALGQVRRRDRILEALLTEGNDLAPEVEPLVRRLWIEQLVANGRLQEAKIEIRTALIAARHREDIGSAMRLMAMRTLLEGGESRVSEEGQWPERSGLRTRVSGG